MSRKLSEAGSSIAIRVEAFEPPPVKFSETPPDVRALIESLLLKLPPLKEIARTDRAEALGIGIQLIEMGILKFVQDQAGEISFKMAKTEYLSVDGIPVPPGWTPFAN